MISKIISEVLVGDVRIDNSVRDFIQNSVASFILHLTAEACTKCDREGRKAITGDDILWSVDRLGFRDYEPPLRTFLRKHRAIESEERMRKRGSGTTMPMDAPMVVTAASSPQGKAQVVRAIVVDRP